MYTLCASVTSWNDVFLNHKHTNGGGGVDFTLTTMIFASTFEYNNNHCAFISINKFTSIIANSRDPDIIAVGYA